MSKSTRDYYRELALSVLHRSDEGMTSDELVEHMGVLAQSEGHPRKLWIDLDAPSVAGHVRALENDGRVIRLPDARLDARHGRPQPVWTYANPRDLQSPVPEPPEDAGQAQPKAVQPRAGTGLRHDMVEGELTVPQAQALLAYGDALMETIHGFLQDLQRVNERARSRLADVGIQVRGR